MANREDEIRELSGYLSDPDPEIRSLAQQGLAEIQGPGPFRAEDMKPRPQAPLPGPVGRLGADQPVKPLSEQQEMARGGSLSHLPWEAQSALFNRPSENAEMQKSRAASMAGLAVGAGSGAAMAPFLTGAVGRLGAAGLSNVMAGSAARGTAAATDERPILDAAFDTDEMGRDLAFGTGAKLLADGAGLASRGIRGTSNVINNYGKARDSGMLDRPNIKALAPGAEGIEESANQALKQIIKRDQELARQAGKSYNDATEPLMSMPVDKGKLVSELEKGRASHFNPDTGLPLRKSVDSRYREEIAKVTGPVPDAPPRTVGGELEAPLQNPTKTTVAGTLANRRALKADAGFRSVNPTPEQEAAREAYKTYRQAVRIAAPDVGVADDAYADYANKATRRRDIVFNTEDDVVRGGGDLPEQPPVEMSDEIVPSSSPAPLRVAKEKSATTLLKRAGDTNEPGIAARRFIDELAEQDPEFLDAINQVLAKKAQEATRFSLDSYQPTSLTGAVMGSGFMPLLKQNSRAIGASADTLATGIRDALNTPSLRAPLLRGIDLDAGEAMARIEKRKKGR